MLIGAVLFVSVFTVGFGYLTTDALRSGRMRGIGWSVGRAEAPIRYWAGVCAYGINVLVAAAFLMFIVALLFVR